METVSDFISWGSKITADGDYSHEIKDSYSLDKCAVDTWVRLLKTRLWEHHLKVRG